MILITNSLKAQLQYIGLKSEGDIRVAQNQLVNSGVYWPKTQVIDNFLYIPTSSGIYRKDLNTVNDTTWSLYAFPNIPVKDFVKKMTQFWPSPHSQRIA